MLDATREWLTMLSCLKHSGREVAPRSPGADWKGRTTRELVAFRTVVPMASPAIASAARKPSYRFMAAEAAWVLSGDNRVETIAPFAPTVKRFSDDGLRFFGSYGVPFVEQLSYAVGCLRRDPASRQSVIRIWRDRPPSETRDVPCTLSWQYLIRDGALDMVATMRSSDAITGWPYDVFVFSMTAAAVAIELRSTRTIGPDHNETSSAFPDLRLGNLYLTAGSQHYYLKDEDVVDAALAEKPVGPPCAPIDLADFASTRDLADHLWSAARGAYPEGARGWMREVCPRKPARAPDDEVKRMVDRFLSWRLPADFNPDGGVSFRPTFNEHTAHPMKHEPTGTNLFDARQAEAMVRHMLEGLP